MGDEGRPRPTLSQPPELFGVEIRICVLWLGLLRVRHHYGNGGGCAAGLWGAIFNMWQCERAAPHVPWRVENVLIAGADELMA
jgi:hypothetical protein